MAQEVAALLLLLLAERSELAAGDPMSRRIPRRVGEPWRPWRPTRPAPITDPEPWLLTGNVVLM